MKKAAWGAAKGAIKAAHASANSDTTPSDPKAAAAYLAKQAAMGAAQGALESAGRNNPVAIDPTTGSVSLDQVTARSPEAMDFYSTMANVAVNQLDMTDAQKAVFLSYTSYALAGLNASIEFNCAWQASVGLNFNIAFPDGYAVYHVLFVPKLQGPMDIIRIEGDYPFVRYFSYQSYDPKSLDPVASVRDYEIKPVRGVNPFATPGTALGDKGKYQVHVTLNGDQGYPNELPTIASGSNATGAFVLLRVYAYDKQSPDKTDIWGAVAPPVVKYKLFNPSSGQGGLWYTLDQCLFRRTGTRAPFVNKDANYLLSCGSEVDGGGVQGNLVAVITGTLPPSPGGLWTPPFVADFTKSNARYLSLSTYDLNIPGPVLQTLFDSDIVDFYTQYYGSEYLWNLRNSRQYKIVAAADLASAKRCGHLTRDAMFLSTWGQTARVSYPALVLREILSQSSRIGDNANNTQSIHNIKQACESIAGVGAKCETSSFASSVMKNFYPKVTYYDCLQGGKSVAAPYNQSATY
ncbi:hypothetical protein NSK_006580 [Nannochloropsis salina CCMP1776]|uniref:Uncharacterized protein n=1 Tax=Nannochloropsis salina CCMP1776 TaxID=1027361 RepID=A0A4D9CRS4_9STRA|nr:hypothetical protein NSK_006580 [Nannochloropsis salina CCMP1776]|eukprot:TFJ81912.1 hypothetical protein NSK_006580 [Nannochloropsis salina CCMP1776]